MASLSTFSLGKDASMKVSGQHCFYATCNDSVEYEAFLRINGQFIEDNRMSKFFDDRTHMLYIQTHVDSTKHNKETGKRDVIEENITFMNKNLKTIFTEFEADRKTKTRFTMHCEHAKQALFVKPDGTRYINPMLSITIDLKNYMLNESTKRATCFVSSMTHPKTHQRLIDGLIKSCDISYIAETENIDTSFVKPDAVLGDNGKFPRIYKFYHLETNKDGNPYLHHNVVSRPTTPVGTKTNPASLYSDENWDNVTTQQVVREESPVFANLACGNGYKDALNKPASAPTTPKTKSKKPEVKIPVAIPAVAKVENKVEVSASVPKPVALALPPSREVPIVMPPKLLNSITTTQTTTRTFSGKNHNLPTSLSIKFGNGDATLKTTDSTINLEELAEYLCNYFVNKKCNVNVASNAIPINPVPITPFNSINNKPPTSPSQMDWSQMSDEDTDYAPSDENA